MKIKYDIEFDIAVAKSARSTKWRNKRQTWGSLLDDLSETTRTDETIKQYFKLGETKEGREKQARIKDVGGFVGGYLLDGRRLKRNVVHRQIVCLDADFADLDVWLDFRGLEISGACYSTHKHTEDAPRLRIVFPLSREVSPDEYEAIAREVASWLDIEKFDDTTYQPERLMYYPSTAKDGEFFFDHIDEGVLDVDAVLDDMTNWSDPTTWARSSRVEDIVKRDVNSNAENPEDKAGLIGAFCRAYTIQEAIDEFLPDVYESCPELGANRYTFIGGTTSGGLVIYDDKFAFSFHSTDPIADDRLYNAFDLVRVHKFGDLDKRDEYADPTKCPSYKAMIELAQDDKKVKHEIIESRKEKTAKAYEDKDEEVGYFEDTFEGWVEEMETDKNGNFKSTIDNVQRILMYDENLCGSFAYNEFDAREVTLRALPWDKKRGKYPRPLKDADDSNLRAYLERAYGITGKNIIDDAVMIVTFGNVINPVKNYLDALEWDGIERLDDLLVDVFGVESTPYVRAVTRKAFVAGVARIYNAGCKFDNVLTIVGEQGKGKSTLFARMGGDWFNESIRDVSSKDALEQIQGSWIVELPELASIKRADVEAVKQFVAKRVDKFRVAYGKRAEDFPRRCVFFGTTNEDDFLRDATGNRRFWVVNITGCEGELDVWDYLDPYTVGQLWAEAKEYFAQGEPLYLDKETEAVAREVQREHLQVDDRAGLVEMYLDRLLPDNWDELDLYERREWLEEPENVGTVRRQRVCLLEIWAECLGNSPTKIPTLDGFAIGRIIKGFSGWQSVGTRAFKIYGKAKAWQR